MYQWYSILIGQGISEPGHIKKVVDVPNGVYKRYIYQMMSTVQLTGSKIFDSQIHIHTGTQNNNVSLDKEFQENQTKKNRKYGAIDQGKS